MLCLFDTPPADWALPERDHPPPAGPVFSCGSSQHSARTTDATWTYMIGWGTTLRRMLPVRPPDGALAGRAYTRPCQWDQRERINISVWHM